MSSILPSKPGDTFVNIYPFEGGSITLPEKFFVAPADENKSSTVPSLAFLIEHPNPPDCPLVRETCPNGKHMGPFHFFFDLGLRSSPDRYISPIDKHLENRKPFDLSPGVAAALSKGHVQPKDVRAIILSHVHYDHHGDPEDFPSSTFFVGHGAKNILNGSLGKVASHQHFDPNLLPQDRAFELPDPNVKRISTGMFRGQSWQPLGPFPATLDLFGDSSVYVLDMPGHLPGHVNLLCRAGPDKWYYLAADAAHDLRLLSGQKVFGTWENELGHRICIHNDVETAKESLRRLQQLIKEEPDRVEVVIAHDPTWAERNRTKFYPNHL